MLRSPSPSEAAPKSRALRPLGQGHQLLGVGQVGVRVTAAEVLQGHAVHDGAGGGAQAVLQDLDGVGPGDRVHGIEAHAELPGVEELADGVEVEQGLHQRRVVAPPGPGPPPACLPRLADARCPGPVPGPVEGAIARPWLWVRA